MKNLIRPKFGSILIAVVILAFVVPLALFSMQTHQTDAASPPHRARPLTGTPIDWPEFHADASRDGNQSGNTQLTKANANTLVPITGAAYTTTGAVNSSPAIVGGVLYYAANSTKTPDASYHVCSLSGDRTSSMEHAVSCLWRYAATVICFVLASRGTGYINALGTTAMEVFIGRGSRNHGGIGCMYDFNGANGSLIWDYVTPGTVLRVRQL